VDSLLDPFADPGAAALSYFRWAFSDPSLDDRMTQVLATMPDPDPRPWAMVAPQVHERRAPGVGRRADMLFWGTWNEDDSVTPLREPSTAALALAYQITGDRAHAERALEAAHTKLMMARRVLRGGREHAVDLGQPGRAAAGYPPLSGTGGTVSGCGTAPLSDQESCLPLPYRSAGLGKDQKTGCGQF